jgi:hypothetical protein
VVLTRLMCVDSAAYVTRTYSQVSTHPRYTVVTHHTTDVSPYRTIGTASIKARLEATGPEFTSPGTRILTFLPWRRCIIVKSKLQKVNRYYLATCQDYYSHYTGIEAYPHRRFSKIWPSMLYYTRTALIPAVTSQP